MRVLMLTASAAVLGAATLFTTMAGQNRSTQLDATVQALLRTSSVNDLRSDSA